MINPINETSIPYQDFEPEKIGVQPSGFRAPAATRLGLVTLQIADLERSLAYYQSIIGFHLLRRGEGRARLGTADGKGLLELFEKPGVRPAPHRGRLGIYHFALLLPSRADLGRFIGHALSKGVHVGQSDHLYSEATYLVDPDGITIEVYRDRSRDEWMVSPEGEILGGAIPLDHPALAEAAGSIPWQGLPNGTTMGHIHFYVGDLEGAERFYHQGLGLAKVTWSYPGALFMSAGGYHHHLGTNIWAAGSRPSSDEDARLLSWELILPDQHAVDGVVSNFKQAGYGVGLSDGAVVVDDPWGIRARIVAEPG